MSMYTMRYIPTSGVNWKLKDKITELEHFLIAKMRKINRIQYYYNVM